MFRLRKPTRRTAHIVWLIVSAVVAVVLTRNMVAAEFVAVYFVVWLLGYWALARAIGRTACARCFHLWRRVACCRREGGRVAAEPQWKVKTDPESRRPVFVAALVIIAGQAWVAHSLRLSPFWLFPLISTVLLAASIAVYEGRDTPGRLARVLSFALSAVLVLANALSLILLVRGVFLGSSLRPTGLLFAGLALWLVNLAVFALLYWELDGGGPEARADGYRDRLPDLVFPQQQADQQGLAAATWKPSFYDYMYVSLTSSIAFSPTDAMPYSKSAKLVMGVESLVSFATLAVIVARAVNIAH